MKPSMWIWPLYSFLLLGAFFCSKEDETRPFAFLHLWVYDPEEELAWDEVRATWNNASRTFELDATGIKHDHCRLSLKNLHSTGPVLPVTIENLYYSDGLTIFPDRLGDGVLEITELSERVVKGRFSFYLEDNLPEAQSVPVTGYFGLEVP